LFVFPSNRLPDGLTIDFIGYPPEIAGMPKVSLNPKPPKRADPDALILSPLVHGRASPLSKSELCEWLHCSPKYIEAEVAKGNLRPHKFSNRMIRFTWDAIDRWLASKAV
jgi:hypothetical protein